MEREQQHQRIEELGAKLAKVNYALEKTGCNLETLGTPSGLPPLDFSQASGPEDLANRLLRVGLTKERLLENALPKLNAQKEKLLREQTMFAVSNLEAKIPEIERLAAKGLLPREQLEKLYQEREALKSKLMPGFEVVFVQPTEEIKPAEAQKPEEEPEKSKREPVRITFIDGTSFEEQRAIIAARILKHLAENLDGYTPEEIKELKRTLEYKPVTNGELAKGLFGEENPSNKMRIWNNMNTAIKLAVKQSWNLEKSTHEKQIKFCLKKIKEQPEEIEELKEYQMTEEEAAMFGSWVLDHNNVELFGLKQDIRRDAPLFTLQFGEEITELCQKLINQCPFDLRDPEETEKAAKERIDLLRKSAVIKLKLICDGGELGKKALEQQPKDVQELLSNVYCFCSDILGDDLCDFLTESPCQRRVIDKETEEIDKSPYMVRNVKKYWIVPSLSFPERIAQYLRKGTVSDETEKIKTAEISAEEVRIEQVVVEVQQPESEETKPAGKKRVKKAAVTDAEKLEKEYPQIREKINLILDCWEEKVDEDPGKRIKGNSLTNVFKLDGIRTIKEADVEVYLGKRYAVSGRSNDHHLGYNQFETTLLLLWRDCQRGQNWNNKKANIISEIIKEEMAKRHPEGK